MRDAAGVSATHARRAAPSARLRSGARPAVVPTAATVARDAAVDARACRRLRDRSAAARVEEAAVRQEVGRATRVRLAAAAARLAARARLTAVVAGAVHEAAASVCDRTAVHPRGTARDRDTARAAAAGACRTAAAARLRSRARSAVDDVAATVPLLSAVHRERGARRGDARRRSAANAGSAAAAARRRSRARSALQETAASIGDRTAVRSGERAGSRRARGGAIRVAGRRVAKEAPGTGVVNPSSRVFTVKNNPVGTTATATPDKGEHAGGDGGPKPTHVAEHYFALCTARISEQWATRVSHAFGTHARARQSLSSCRLARGATCMSARALRRR